MTYLLKHWFKSSKIATLYLRFMFLNIARSSLCFDKSALRGNISMFLLDLILINCNFVLEGWQKSLERYCWRLIVSLWFLQKKIKTYYKFTGIQRSNNTDFSRYQLVKNEYTNLDAWSVGASFIKKVCPCTSDLSKTVQYFCNEYYFKWAENNSKIVKLKFFLEKYGHVSSRLADKVCKASHECTIVFYVLICHRIMVWVYLTFTFDEIKRLIRAKELVFDL
jgi:hypothetical protein